MRELKRRNRLLDQENEILRRGSGVLRPGTAPKLTYPLVFDLAAGGIPVTVTCEVLGFTTQAFNKWRRAAVSQRDCDDAHPINATLDIHADNPGFGYRLIVDELAAAGAIAGKRRVWRIRSQHGIWNSFAKRRGLTRKAGPPVHDHLGQRRFVAPVLNRLWLTDSTEHRTDGGNLYLYAVKDVCSPQIVDYSIADRMTSSPAVAALRNAVRLRISAGATVHWTAGGSSVSRPTSASRRPTD